jgi:hypothetical protein
MSRSPLAFVLAAWLLAWAAIMVAVPPSVQEFPLNDDWAFARGAFAFARGEGLHYYGWSSMPLWGMWLCAWPFVKAFGESHVALRLCTLTLAMAGLVSFNDLLEQQGVRPGRAAVAVSLLAFNPVGFLLAGTFMSDVPALALSLVSLALLNRALRSRSVKLMLSAALVGAAAATTRQNASMIGVVAALLLGTDPVLRKRSAWWVLALAPVAAGLVAHWWLSERNDVRSLAPSMPDPESLLLVPFACAHWLGLAVLPLIVLDSRFGRAGWTAASIMMLAAGYWAWMPDFSAYGRWYPYIENMLSPWGAFAGGLTGPLMPGHRPVILGTEMRIVLTIGGCIGAGWWTSRVISTPLVARMTLSSPPMWGEGKASTERVKQREAKTDGGMIGLSWWNPLGLYTLAQLPFFFLTPDVYDRYFLVLLPGLVALVLPRGSATRWHTLAAWSFVAAFGLFSIGLMHDWLAWNATRWSLGRSATLEVAPAEDIEGGVEWDAWYASAPGASRMPQRQAGLALPFTRQWFPQVSGRYAISFSTYPRTRVVRQSSYKSWLLGRDLPLYLLTTSAGEKTKNRSSKRAGGGFAFIVRVRDYDCRKYVQYSDKELSVLLVGA